MGRLFLSVFVVLVAIISAGPGFAGSVEANAVFERLKLLAGTWEGTPEAQGEIQAEAHEDTKVRHVFEVSAAGTVVMETMGPGTDHEMINMYHLDGDDLVLTHYCAGGNQPTMRLNREASTAHNLVFDFTGGTNLDPAVDTHIHAAEITLNGEGAMISSWKPYAGGKPVGTMTFHLARAE